MIFGVLSYYLFMNMLKIFLLCTGCRFQSAYKVLTAGWRGRQPGSFSSCHPRGEVIVFRIWTYSVVLPRLFHLLNNFRPQQLTTVCVFEVVQQVKRIEVIIELFRYIALKSHSFLYKTWKSMKQPGYLEVGMAELCKQSKEGGEEGYVGCME